MKRILKNRILPLLCVGLLLCTPHTIAYATADGIESTTPPPVETTPPPVETTPPSVEITPPPVETTPPPVETTPPPVETTPPPVETTPPPVETTPPPVETTPPPVETTPPPVETTPPPVETTPPTVYSVEISWKSLVFDCTQLWNPDKHCYDRWEFTENPITVTNTTKNGAPIRVTMTFIPIDKMGATAEFAPCEDDPNPEDFTFSEGQVTFMLPRDVDSKAQTTVNLFLTGDPTGWETQQYNKIGSIKTEIAPLSPGVSDIQPPPVSNLPLPKQEQGSTSDVMLPPKQNSKEEAQTAPHTESGASPQEEPQ